MAFVDISLWDKKKIKKILWMQPCLHFLCSNRIIETSLKQDTFILEAKVSKIREN